MSFKFAIRPANLAEAEDIFQLLVNANIFDGTLEALTAEIMGTRSATYWVAARDGLLLGVLRASALGAGFSRSIAADQIVFAPALQTCAKDISALEVVTMLLARALGDIPAFAVVNEAQYPRDSQELDGLQETSMLAPLPALALISKALLAAGFAPDITAGTSGESAELGESAGVAESGERVENGGSVTLSVRKQLANMLGVHVLGGQVFVR